MRDFIVTGASRGIGRALSLGLAKRGRLILLARETAALHELTKEINASGGCAMALPVDLSSMSDTKRASEVLAQTLAADGIMIHNAGLWPTQRQLTQEGLEPSLVVNCIAPLLLQAPSIEKRLLSRVMMVSAGLLIKGRFDAEKTPTGKDFSRFRTYCTTKLCGALLMRDVAAQHPELDVLVLHPGVVRTELGAMRGPLGWLLSLVKRLWESPEVCAARLARILERDRWSTPGSAAWMLEEKAQPWPDIANNKETQEAVRRVVASLKG